MAVKCKAKQGKLPSLVCRNEQMRAMRQSGYALVDIAKRYKVSQQRVSQILGATGRIPLAKYAEIKATRQAEKEQKRQAFLKRWNRVIGLTNYRLTCIRRDGQWLFCQCKCGNTKWVHRGNFTRTKSCGCLLQEYYDSGSANRIIHGRNQQKTA